APDTGQDRALDAIAIRLRTGLAPWPQAAGRLAVAGGRLVEGSPVLGPEARRLRPLGGGLEPLLEDRLRPRLALVPEPVARLLALHRHLALLMEEPAEGVAAVERDLGGPLDPAGRDWLEIERRAAILRFVRRDKTEQGHIRWFVRAEA